MHKIGDLPSQEEFSFRLRLYLPLWQEPDIAQWAQLQPQEDLPFFLFRTRLTIIAATTAISTRHIITVAIFVFNHNNIQKTPFKEWVFFKLLLLK